MSSRKQLLISGIIFGAVGYGVYQYLSERGESTNQIDERDSHPLNQRFREKISKTNISTKKEDNQRNESNIDNKIVGNELSETSDKSTKPQTNTRLSDDWPKEPLL